MEINKFEVLNGGQLKADENIKYKNFVYKFINLIFFRMVFMRRFIQIDLLG